MKLSIRPITWVILVSSNMIAAPTFADATISVGATSTNIELNDPISATGYFAATGFELPHNLTLDLQFLETQNTEHKARFSSGGVLLAYHQRLSTNVFANFRGGVVNNQLTIDGETDTGAGMAVGLGIAWAFSSSNISLDIASLDNSIRAISINLSYPPYQRKPTPIASTVIEPSPPEPIDTKPATDPAPASTEKPIEKPIVQVVPLDTLKTMMQPAPEKPVEKPTAQELYNDGLYVQAIEVLQAMASPDTRLLALSYQNLTKQYLQNGDAIRAKHIVEKYLAALPDDADALILKKQLSPQQSPAVVSPAPPTTKHSKKAVDREIPKPIAPVDLTKVITLTSQAEFYYKEGNSELAKAKWEQVLAIDKDNSAAKAGLARIQKWSEQDLKKSTSDDSRSK